MFNIMPMVRNGIQAPSGEQPEHLENVICDDFEVGGPCRRENDHCARPLYARIFSIPRCEALAEGEAAAEQEEEASARCEALAKPRQRLQEEAAAAKTEQGEAGVAGPQYKRDEG